MPKPLIECELNVTPEGTEHVGVDFTIKQDGKPVYKVLVDPVDARTANPEQFAAVMNQIRDVACAVDVKLIRQEVLKVPGVRDVVPIV